MRIFFFETKYSAAALSLSSWWLTVLHFSSPLCRRSHLLKNQPVHHPLFWHRSAVLQTHMPLCHQRCYPPPGHCPKMPLAKLPATLCQRLFVFHLEQGVLGKARERATLPPSTTILLPLPSTRDLLEETSGKMKKSLGNRNKAGEPSNMASVEAEQKRQKGQKGSESHPVQF